MFEVILPVWSCGIKRSSHLSLRFLLARCSQQDSIQTDINRPMFSVALQEYVIETLLIGWMVLMVPVVPELHSKFMLAFYPKWQTELFNMSLFRPKINKTVAFWSETKLNCMFSVNSVVLIKDP